MQIKAGVYNMAFELHDVNLCDIDAVSAALDKASADAVAGGKIMTLIRLAYYLGVGRHTVGDISKGAVTTFRGRKIPEEVSSAIKKAADYCELCVADAGFAARNPAMSIFVLKANHDYDDKPASVISANTVIFSGTDNIAD